VFSRFCKRDVGLREFLAVNDDVLERVDYNALLLKKVLKIVSHDYRKTLKIVLELGSNPLNPKILANSCILWCVCSTATRRRYSSAMSVLPR